MSNFITDCINGDALMVDIDEYITSWHEGGSDEELFVFLGMSKKEYALFIEEDTYLGLIISSHKDEIDIDEIIRDEIAMAARSDNKSKSVRLQKWLESEGLWD